MYRECCLRRRSQDLASMRRLGDGSGLLFSTRIGPSATTSAAPGRKAETSLHAAPNTRNRSGFIGYQHTAIQNRSTGHVCPFQKQVRRNVNRVRSSRNVFCRRPCSAVAGVHAQPSADETSLATDLRGGGLVIL